MANVYPKKIFGYTKPDGTEQLVYAHGYMVDNNGILHFQQVFETTQGFVPSTIFSLRPDFWGQVWEVGPDCRPYYQTNESVKILNHQGSIA